MRDPYEVLGLARGAGAAEIKAAYRRLAKRYHPDAQGADGRPPGKSRFQEVTAAYNLLKDSAARARFDARPRPSRARAKPTASQFEEAPFATGAARNERIFEAESAKGNEGDKGGRDDLFSELFEGIRSAGKRVFRARGEDQPYRLSVTFLEAACGARRRVTLKNGKTLDVRIPAGIEDGQQIRLRGQGGEGHGGATAGDALVAVTIESHDRFTRDGLDIHLTVSVSLPEAVLGARIEVETISGPVTLLIPEGSGTGTRLRLKQRGISLEGGGRTGDQYVTLALVLPEKPDHELRDFAAGWKQGLAHAPREKS